MFIVSGCASPQGFISHDKPDADNASSFWDWMPQLAPGEYYSKKF
jgi:hypothetical protein